MYEQFWGLNCKPFENRLSTDMYYASEQHQAAELKLRYVLESRLPAALLTGGAGVGKTLLLQILEEQYRGDLAFHHIQFPQLPKEQMLAYLASRLSGEGGAAARTVADSLRCIEDNLSEFAANEQHVCMVVDECHAMPSESFETIRLLLNLNDATPRLTVLMAGQPQLRKTLQVMPQFEERLAVRLNLSRLSADDTAKYVEHRLEAAGASRPVFSDEAIVAIHQATAGVPGRINRLADMTLLVGFADDVSMITPAQIRNVDQGLFTMPWAA